MYDTRLTHERVWQDDVKPFLVDHADRYLATMEIGKDKVIDSLSDMLYSDKVATVVLGLTIITTACAVVLLTVKGLL